MREHSRSSATLRVVFAGVALASLIWLSVLAVRPTAIRWLPSGLRGFGAPGSAPTLIIVIGAVIGLCTFSFRSHRDRRGNTVPFVVIGGLAAASAVLGFSSFAGCHDSTHPAFFQPLLWTVSLVKGGVADYSLGKQVCPSVTPEALWAARLMSVGAIFTGLAGVVITLFQSQSDRLRANFASSVTAVVGTDDETRFLIGAIATTLRRSCTLVVITDGTDQATAYEARRHGGRVVTVDFNAPNSVAALRCWRNLERLYLMAPDPLTNQLRLDAITRAMSKVAHRQRIPLTVRIDDPWQAEAWRATQLGGSDTRWAADAVGKYEITARWLLRNLCANTSVDQVYVCGASELTLALCADLARRKLEHDYYATPGDESLPAMTLVSDQAQEHLQDHQFRRRQVGLATTGPTIDAQAETPSVPVLLRLIANDPGSSSAVIFVDDPREGSALRSTGSRLAARCPDTLVFVWDPEAQSSSGTAPIIGRLRSYRLGFDVADGRAEDLWERAARLIHQRYLALVGPEAAPPPARQPWPELSEFYRESNRRQVRNALRMVEQIADHTWNTWGTTTAPLSTHDMAGLSALQKLERMGFDHSAAFAMAEAEHEDWCRYYRRHHWKYGPVRDDAHRVHDKLLAWSVLDADSVMVDAALTSLAATLWSLRQLGYRSRSVWQQFARVGTVTATQLNAPWTWTSPSGHLMHAAPGDWRVNSGADSWSVRDAIFRASYEHRGGDQWQQCGVVDARPAHAGEAIATLEGTTTAAEGDWVVRGADGEQWPVPADEFARRYVARTADTTAAVAVSGT